ncbi:TlpA disulfide reductase family protein [Hydrogenophaga sp.]|uniref:TlpA family protein disulfide reductase n=1 Tax=Hydrogenophaga sp. TaxID=1904254 RepID=UPI0025B993E6|nr:TlpA disulfide reductase family protein [Hydrogenophaga sp.]
MPSAPDRDRRRLLGLCAASLLAITPPTFAQTAPPTLEGIDSQARPFDLTRLRGQVVMVMFWSTACAVCRDKMPELRANLRGWLGQPFTLVGVNTDPERASFDEWERLVSLTVPAELRFVQLWRGDARHRDSFGPTGVLPATYLIDKQGRVANSFHGRIPAEAWDRIADLL